MNILFDTGNAAFDDDNHAHECARILRVIAAQVEQGEEGGLIRDLNGQKIGEWWSK